MIAGLLGEKLSHSYSPKIHNLLTQKYEYKLFELEKEHIEEFIKFGKYDCLNVTIPYKKDVMKFADYISPIAESIGSANTLVKKNGKIYLDNTDYYGFLLLLDKIKVKNRNKALVLGTGGASLAIKKALFDYGFKCIVSISRTGNDNYSNIFNHSDANIIVNTTPVGMYPETLNSPISDITIFKNLEAVYDIIYNPKRTALIMDAEKHGIACISGLYMLVAQAAKSSSIFTGNEIK